MMCEDVKVGWSERDLGDAGGQERGRLTILVSLLLDFLGDLVVQLGVGGVSLGRRHIDEVEG